jgi:hypothetical protein
MNRISLCLILWLLMQASPNLALAGSGDLCTAALADYLGRYPRPPSRKVAVLGEHRIGSAIYASHVVAVVVVDCRHEPVRRSIVASVEPTGDRFLFDGNSMGPDPRPFRRPFEPSLSEFNAMAEQAGCTVNDANVEDYWKLFLRLSCDARIVSREGGTSASDEMGFTASRAEGCFVVESCFGVQGWEWKCRAQIFENGLISICEVTELKRGVLLLGTEPTPGAQPTGPANGVR